MSMIMQNLSNTAQQLRRRMEQARLAAPGVPIDEEKLAEQEALRAAQEEAVRAAAAEQSELPRKTSSLSSADRCNASQPVAKLTRLANHDDVSTGRVDSPPASSESPTLRPGHRATSAESIQRLCSELVGKPAAAPAPAAAAAAPLRSVALPLPMQLDPMPVPLHKPSAVPPAFRAISSSSTEVPRHLRAMIHVNNPPKPTAPQDSPFH